MRICKFRDILDESEENAGKQKNSSSNPFNHPYRKVIFVPSKPIVYEIPVRLFAHPDFFLFRMSSRKNDAGCCHSA